MNFVWLAIMLASLSASVSCDQAFDLSRITAFPAENRTIAGVSQITYLDDHNLLQYAFNASEARNLCSSLGLTIASKAQVSRSLAGGLETCRFGWVDEHFAVVPRSKPLSNCGQNRTGLVTWRAEVTKKFDVFCFNESDAEAQLRTTPPTDSIGVSEETHSPTEALNSAQSEAPTSYSSPHSPPPTPDSESSDVQPARFLGGAQSSSGAKVILITSTCAVILLAVIIVAYIKMRQGRSQSSDLKQQQEDAPTEEWTCLKTIKQSETADSVSMEEDCEESSKD